MSLEHSWPRGAPFVFHPERHRAGDGVTQFCYLKFDTFKLNFSIFEVAKLTDRKACIRSALTVAKGFPLTKIVNVSSFSVVISDPNQDFFVNSGEDSGVKWTSSEEAREYSTTMEYG